MSGLDIDVDVLKVVLAVGDALVELASTACLRSRPVGHVAAFERDGCAPVVLVAFAFCVACSALVAGGTSGCTVLVGHLVLRHPQLRSLADTLPSTAFDHMDLAGVLVRRLPPLHGATMSRVSVVLCANGGLGARSTRRV